MTAPPDLLIRASIAIPNLDVCCDRLFQQARRQSESSSSFSTSSLERVERLGSDCDAESHQAAVAALADIANGPPSQCIFTPMRLPVGVQGMLPRLWKVRQRVQLLRRSAVALTLAWTRDLLHLLLPHWLALRADDVFLGGGSKCSLTFAEVSLEDTQGQETVTAPLSIFRKRKRRTGSKEVKSACHFLSGEHH